MKAPRKRAAFSLLMAASLPLAACNAITGADDLVLFADGEGGHGNEGGDGAGAGIPTHHDDGGNGGSGTTSMTPVESYGDVAGVTIQSIALLYHRDCGSVPSTTWSVVMRPV